MLIRLVPPSPHPTVLYGLTFPSVLSLPDTSPSATIPPAWSSQLQLITSVLQLEPPSSIHMLDRAVGLVARVDEVTMDVPRKEFVVRFVDDRVVHVPMSSDSVRMLLGVVVDVKGCSEPDSQRNSTESSACPGSFSGGTEDAPSLPGPTKPPKLGKHKRQRSLLFSLISSLVPKSLSSHHPPPSSAPPPAPLPPLPVASPMSTPPASPQQACFPAEQQNPSILRKRARATLIDVWRRHVVSALAPEHLPAAGYAEWTLLSMANRARAEIESMENAIHGFGGGNRHRRTQSDGRNALDFGDRYDARESQRWCRRAPSPFPDTSTADDSDHIVYPRREQDEWGVRYGSDEPDVFAVGYAGFDDSLFHLTLNGDTNSNEHLGFNRLGDQEASDFGSGSLGLDVKQAADFALHRSRHNGDKRANMPFDMSRYSLVPSDVNDDGSDESLTSIRTPVDGEDLPILPPVQGSRKDASWTSSESPAVSRVSSSRPRSRNSSTESLRLPSALHSSSSPAYTSSSVHNFDCRFTTEEELMAAQFDYLERIHSAIDIVRSRARDEGWRLIRSTLIGAKNGWMDAETERSLEVKAKRRAWSSGIKIPAPYTTSRSSPKVWDGSFSSFLRSPRSPVRPPGLASPLTEILRVRGPIVPTGLSLGIPVRSSPLATYVWGAEVVQNTTPRKSGVPRPVHTMETVEAKRPLRTTDVATKLLPVHEEDEDLSEPSQVYASGIGFPRTVPLIIATEEHDRSFMEESMENGDDPFYFCPSQPRSRTTSMYAIPPPPSSSSPFLPLLRPSTPPPSYQTAIGEDTSTATDDHNGESGASALLLQPLSSLSISPPCSPTSQPALPSNPSFISRPRSVSLPAPKTYPGSSKTRRTSFDYQNEPFEDLSQAYASPPPEGPLVVSAAPAPHKEYPRYAHIRSPIPTSKKSHSSILGGAGAEMVFEQAGSEFTVGIEVALGRAEEGRVVWRGELL